MIDARWTKGSGSELFNSQRGVLNYDELYRVAERNWSSLRAFVRDDKEFYNQWNGLMKFEMCYLKYKTTLHFHYQHCVYNGTDDNNNNKRSQNSIKLG